MGHEAAFLCSHELANGHYSPVYAQFFQEWLLNILTSFLCRCKIVMVTAMFLSISQTTPLVGIKPFYNNFDLSFHWYSHSPLIDVSMIDDSIHRQSHNMPIFPSDCHCSVNGGLPMCVRTGDIYKLRHVGPAIMAQCGIKIINAVFHHISQLFQQCYRYYGP